jgi:hypothetical protein
MLTHFNTLRIFTTLFPKINFNIISPISLVFQVATIEELSLLKSCIHFLFPLSEIIISPSYLLDLTALTIYCDIMPEKSSAAMQRLDKQVSVTKNVWRNHRGYVTRISGAISQWWLGARELQ